LKFQIRCKSLLLQKALEEFLKDYISNDGLVISDEKGDIIIGKDIKKPFSKEQLLKQLKEIYYMKVNSNSFEEKLDRLIDEFSYKLKLLIKEEYGKK